MSGLFEKIIAQIFYDPGITATALTKVEDNSLALCKTVKNVINLLDGCGATLYLQAELDRHRNLGLTALEKTESVSPAATQLAELINKMRAD